MKKYVWMGTILLLLMRVGCGGGSQSDQVDESLEAVPTEFAGKVNPLGPEAVAAGAEVYNSYCVACHGEKGYGDGAAGSSLNPPPRNLVVLQTQVGDDYLFWKINTGKEGTAMVAWQGILDDEQIWQVVTFIRTLK